MSKVTSKLQLTLPKVVADQYGIRPGDELQWIPAGEGIRVEILRRRAKRGATLTTEERLAAFDANTTWLDELQADQLKEAKAKRTRISREKRGCLHIPHQALVEFVRAVTADPRP